MKEVHSRLEADVPTRGPHSNGIRARGPGHKTPRLIGPDLERALLQLDLDRNTRDVPFFRVSARDGGLAEGSGVPWRFARAVGKLTD